MKVIIVAYNQFELLQMEIEALRLLAGIEERDLIIVDNGSEDGLRQWLEERPGMNYLICDEGGESYSARRLPHHHGDLRASCVLVRRFRTSISKKTARPQPYSAAKSIDIHLRMASEIRMSLALILIWSRYMTMMSSARRWPWKKLRLIQ